MSYYCWVLAIMAMCGCVQAQDEVVTVPELKVEKYLGRWYQLYASPIVYATFEENGVCVTADYGPYNATAVTVYNHMRLFLPVGTAEDIDGFALLTDEPGKLEVFLDNGEDFGAPYWVTRLGPETFGEEGLYEFAVVTDPFRLFLFVLVRDIASFEQLYEAELLEYLYDEGFDTALNLPIKTYHDELCLYPEES